MLNRLFLLQFIYKYIIITIFIEYCYIILKFYIGGIYGFWVFFIRSIRDSLKFSRLKQVKTL